MFCRRVWQRLGPGVLRVFTPTFSKAPVRHMALGVPGGSTNMAYFVLCGGGLTAAVVYAYKTVNGDIERYEDRLANMASTAKADEEAAPEVIPVKQQVLASEAVAESVAAPAEGAVEPVDESAAPEVDAGEVSEVLSTEEEEEAAAEETVALEEVVEDTLVTDEVETPTEAPSAESAGTSVVDEALPPGPAADMSA
nr:protein MGARP-like [Nerophis lumbriciformis]